MSMKTATRNELAWGLYATKNPPRVSNHAERGPIQREYARLHLLLKAIDEDDRGWAPVTLQKTSTTL